MCYGSFIRPTVIAYLLRVMRHAGPRGYKDIEGRQNPCAPRGHHLESPTLPKGAGTHTTVYESLGCQLSKAHRDPPRAAPTVDTWQLRLREGQGHSKEGAGPGAQVRFLAS